MNLKYLLATATFAAASVLGAAAQAAPVTIGFDNLASGTVVGAAYAGLGVTFSNAQAFDMGGLAGDSAPNVLVSESDFTLTNPNNPIVALFASPVSSVSLTGLDIGAGGFILTAYDAATGGNVLDTRQVFGTEFGFGEFFDLTVQGMANILRVEFSQAIASDTDGISFDNFSFDTERAAAVPEPGTLALLALGLGGLLLRRRA